MRGLYALSVFLPTIALGSILWPNSMNQQRQPLPINNEILEEFNDNLITKSSIQMPGVITQENETYLCTSYALNNDDTNFLVGFEPIADIKGVHHVLLFGCEEPGSSEIVWNCGEMTHVPKTNARAPACTSQPNILYAWAHDAPKFELPSGVAFRVGAGTRSNYFVLQVHYMHATQRKDYSGVAVISTPIPEPRTAATLLMVTGGEIKPQTTETLESACVVDEPIEIHPFAFRVHTHRHGTKVKGWMVEENQINGEDKWTLLGERNPQLPQLFETMKNQSLIVSQGNILAARCHIKNDENRVIKIGPTGEDEMCNFYLMYWVDGDKTLTDNVCFSPGPPRYSWGREAGLNHIPK